MGPEGGISPTSTGCSSYVHICPINIAILRYKKNPEGIFEIILRCSRMTGDTDRNYQELNMWMLKGLKYPWLVVQPPLWKISVRQLGWWMQPNINGKIQKMATKPPTRSSQCFLSVHRAPPCQSQSPSHSAPAYEGPWTSKSLAWEPREPLSRPSHETNILMTRNWSCPTVTEAIL